MSISTVTSNANKRESEDTATTVASTVIFDIFVREVLIINDGLTNDLQYKFSPSENFSTLKTEEQVSLDIRTKTIILQAAAGTTPYRVVALG